MEMFIVYSSITSSGKINFQHVRAFMAKGGKWIVGDSLRSHLINVTHLLSLSLLRHLTLPRPSFGGISMC